MSRINHDPARPGSHRLMTVLAAKGATSVLEPASIVTLADNARPSAQTPIAVLPATRVAAAVPTLQFGSSHL